MTLTDRINRQKPAPKVEPQKPTWLQRMTAKDLTRLVVAS